MNQKFLLFSEGPLLVELGILRDSRTGSELPSAQASSTTQGGPTKGVGFGVLRIPCRRLRCPQTREPFFEKETTHLPRPAIFRGSDMLVFKGVNG